MKKVKEVIEILEEFYVDIARLREKKLGQLLAATGAQPSECGAFTHIGPPRRVQYCAPNASVTLWEEWDLTMTTVTFRFEKVTP